MKKRLVTFGILLVFSCSKPANPEKDPDPDPNPGNPAPDIQLTLNSVSPASGEFLPITITGTGFNSIQSANTVHIGGIPATVIKVTSTQLEVLVPSTLSAGDHDIMVTVKGKSVTKSKAYHLVGWIVSNFVGSGASAQIDSIGNDAAFIQPSGMVIDTDGNLYVIDLNRIRKITPGGKVSTYAGSVSGAVNDVGAKARFNLPASLAIDKNNNIYVADQYNHLIRKITPERNVTTIAGTLGVMGNADGVGTNASFSLPYGVAVNQDGTKLYIGDYANHIIRSINLSDNSVSTIAGNGTAIRKDGAGLLAGIPSPGNLAFDLNGNLIITEKGGGMIRKLLPSGNVSTIGGFSTRQDVTTMPTQLAFDKDNNIFVTYSGLNRIRKFDVNEVESNFAGAATGPDMEDGPATLVQFKWPEGIVITYDLQGNKVFYIVDKLRRKIKKITRE